MKSIEILLLLCFVACLSAFAEEVDKATPGSKSFLDAKYGFRDVKFGQASKEIKGLLKKKADVIEQLHIRVPNETVYVRKKEILSLGNVGLAEIRYVFLRDKLWKVELDAYGPGWKEAIVTLTEAYGKPDYSDEDDSDLKVNALWNGSRASAEIKLMMFGGSASGNTCAIEIFSNELAREWAAALKLEVDKADSDTKKKRREGAEGM